jgi:hypothetical protein
MAMDRWERKKALKHGAVTRIAGKTGLSVQHVSGVINGDRETGR